MAKKKTSKKKVIISLAIILICAVGLFSIYVLNQEQDKETHYHADFKVYVEGEFYNFSQEEFMSTPENIQSRNVHLHDDNGKIIHYHAEGITLENFFSSIGINFTSSCIEVDQVEYCSDGEKQLVMIVNGEITPLNPQYIAKDLDRILIAHVSLEENATELFENVTDEACIQSGQCPERGDPFDESSCGPTSCSVDLS